MGWPGEAAGLDRGIETEKLPEAEAKAKNEQHDEAEDESDDDDCFFETLDRVPSGVSLDLDHPSSSSDSDEDDGDVRISFVSAIDAPRFSICVGDFDDYFYEDDDGTGGFDYGIWMAEPVSLTERRRRLLHGMGLTSRKDLTLSKSRHSTKTASHLSLPPLPPSSTADKLALSAPVPPPSPPKPASLARCLSDSHIPFQAPVAEGLVRSFSSPSYPWLSRTGKKGDAFGAGSKNERGGAAEPDDGEAGAGAYKIKNLDTGKEFVVSEVGKDGTCGRLNDVQTGLQLTMDEFDRFIGFSPIVKELMRRVNLGEAKKRNGGGNDCSTCQGYGRKSSKSGSRKSGSWLKNIKFVASSVTGLISEKDRYHGVSAAAASGEGFGVGKLSSLNGNSLDWLKVHRHRKSYKELTGLYMCQEIQAHQGSIWCMRFSSDGRFLASAGEDRTVHVWQVMESDTFSTFSPPRQQESCFSSAAGALNMSESSRMEQAAILGSHPSNRKRKKSKLGSRKHSLPDYVVLPDTIFSISKRPFCSFEGHLDDILDLCWSKSQHLLSSSMDKTVRLWDMESRTCLKLFAHNDFVTSIQFNPMDDNYFISGSLDGKVRIWSIPKRQVVDWSDLHEMVTAVCYTPDGQGALVGSHKGSFCFYSISADDKLSQGSQIDISNKKKKSHAKKITGFQYAPDNPSHVMVTSAGSMIRVFDGVDIIQKFRGFRNTSSQISASFSSDGRYIVCASEDSNVYIWKRGTKRSASGGKSKGWVTTRSHEYFYCKDVSVAMPWPNNGSKYVKHNLPSPSSSKLGASNRSQKSTFSIDNPFPKKCSLEEMLHTSTETAQASSSRVSSGLSNSPSLHSLRFSVNSSSSFAPWGWGGGGNKVAASGMESSNAWGLVVVTAGLGGNIRIYQNFGFPVRLNRQNNLF